MSRSVTPQAARLIEAVRSLGIPRDQWSVRTETTILRDNGKRYREYGDAILTPKTRDAREAIIQFAQRLADAQLSVTLAHLATGTVVPIVSSRSNPRCRVEHVHHSEPTESE